LEDNRKPDSTQPYGTLVSAKNWLTVRKLQEKLGVGQSSAYRFVHARVRHARVGELMRVHHDDLDVALRELPR
jgi:predicted transcriptional regulator